MERFFIDHGVIHDRETGKHIVTDGKPPFEDSPEQVCAFLNGLCRPPDSLTEYDLLAMREAERTSSIGRKLDAANTKRLLAIIVRENAKSADKRGMGE